MNKLRDIFSFAGPNPSQAGHKRNANAHPAKKDFNPLETADSNTYSATGELDGKQFAT